MASKGTSTPKLEINKLPEWPQDLCYNVDTLFEKAIQVIVSRLHLFGDDLIILPVRIKDRLLRLMMLRGLLTNDNISAVLHENVHRLELCECDVGDVALHQIAARCKNLCKIDLNALKSSRTNITSHGFMSLVQGCPRLQVVYLRRCTSLTDDAIVELSRCCRQLRELDIGGCSLMTDLSLYALADRCPQLRSLNFSRANVSDEGVIRLARGASSQVLTEMHMDGCMYLTDESVEAVAQFCPNINILIFHGCSNITERSREALAELISSRSPLTQLTWTVY